MPANSADIEITPARFRWQRIAEFVIVLAIIVEVIVFASIAPQFLSIPNLVNILLSLAIIGILAVGMTGVILIGGIDLSVGSVAALAGIAGALAAKSSSASGALSVTFILIASSLAVGLATGALNAVMIARFRVPPFVVTLALLTIARGLAFIVTGGRSFGNLPPGFELLGRGQIFGVPLPVAVMLVVFFAGWFVLRHTVFGRYVYATGGNREAAYLAGINPARITAAIYIINGLLVGLAGATLASRLGAGVPSAGVQYELDVIAAVVVGGTSLNGGRGSVVKTLWGAIFIGVLNNGMNLAGIDPYIQKITLGIVILVAVLADQIGKPATKI